MKLLLDTHIWLWIHREPWKLTSEVNQALADPQVDLWLSPVSVWELAVLLEKKRVTLQEDESLGRKIEKGAVPEGSSLFVGSGERNSVYAACTPRSRGPVSGGDRESVSVDASHRR
jgi:hypothetical protein